MPYFDEYLFFNNNTKTLLGIFYTFFIYESLMLLIK